MGYLPGPQLHRTVQLLYLFGGGPILLFLIFTGLAPFSDAPTVALMAGVAMIGAAGGLFLSWRGHHGAGVWFSAVISSVAIFWGALITRGDAYRMLYYLGVPVLFLGLQVPRRQLRWLISFNLAGILLIALWFAPPAQQRNLLLGPGLLSVFGTALIYFALWYRDQAEAAREAAIAEREERYRSLLEAMTDGFMIYANEKILEINAGYAEIFGYQVGEVPGMSLWSFVAEESVPIVMDRMQRTHYQPTEIFGVRRDGSRLRLEFTARTIEYNGEPARMVAVRSVQERYEREQEAQMLQRFAAGLRKAPTREQMPDVILALLEEMLGSQCGALVLARPSDGRLMVEQMRGGPLVNEALCRQAATSRQALWLKPAGTCGARGIIPLLVEDESIGCLWIGRRHDFSALEQRILLGIGGMISRALHRATRHQQTAYYATELEARVAERTRELTEANERLQELDRLKSKFVSDVTHELRTPVTNLGLYLDLLEMGPAAKRKRYMVTLKKQAARLRNLLENILDLSRLEDGRQAIEWEVLDLDDVVGEVVTGHRPRAEAAGLELHYAAGGGPPVRGNRSLLARVAINLISNAINYTEEGHVAVETVYDPAGEWVELRVSDTGPGIEEKDLPHLFERFYRGRVAGSSNIPGTGLGLSIVREIVESHDGTVRVESESGVGSRFIVQLPV